MVLDCTSSTNHTRTAYYQSYMNNIVLTVHVQSKYQPYMKNLVPAVHVQSKYQTYMYNRSTKRTCTIEAPNVHVQSKFQQYMYNLVPTVHASTWELLPREGWRWRGEGWMRDGSTGLREPCRVHLGV